MTSLRFTSITAADVDDGLLAELVELFELSFGVWPHRPIHCPAIDHLRWKISSPSSPLGVLTGRREGRLVQAATIRSARLRLEGRRLLVLHHPDAAVHPDEQGNGVYREALRYIVGSKRPPYDIAFDERAAHAAMQHLHRTDPRFPLPGNRICTLFATFDAKRILEDPDRVVGGWRRLAARGVLPTLQRLPRSTATAERTRHVRTIDRFDARVETLFEAASQSFDALVERTRDHLNWRYCAPEAGPLEARIWEGDGGELRGYSVVRRDPTHWQIADLLVEPHRPDVLEDLVLDARDRARESGAAAISLWLPRRHPYRKTLRQAGFYDARSSAGIRYRAADTPLADLAAFARPDLRFHFTIGDSDLV